MFKSVKWILYSRFSFILVLEALFLLVNFYPVKFLFSPHSHAVYYKYLGELLAEGTKIDCIATVLDSFSTQSDWFCSLFYLFAVLFISNLLHKKESLVLLNLPVKKSGFFFAVLFSLFLIFLFFFVQLFSVFSLPLLNPANPLAQDLLKPLIIYAILRFFIIFTFILLIFYLSLFFKNFIIPATIFLLSFFLVSGNLITPCCLRFPLLSFIIPSQFLLVVKKKITDFGFFAPGLFYRTSGYIILISVFYNILLVFLSYKKSKKIEVW